MSSMQDFFTRQKAREGIKFPLTLPDGTDSEHWITVRGVDSDEFRLAENKAKRSAMSLLDLDDENERSAAIRKAELECITSLIASWSFEEECTFANVLNFLTEAPHISDAVNRLAARRQNYFEKKPNSSTNGQDTK